MAGKFEEVVGGWMGGSKSCCIFNNLIPPSERNPNADLRITEYF
jgi:hypothetical protein